MLMNSSGFVVRKLDSEIPIVTGIFSHSHDYKMNRNSEFNSDKQSKCDRQRCPKSLPLNECSKPAKSKRWHKILAVALLLLGGSAGGGALYGWYFLQRKLVPLVETEVSKYLHRPLELGKLKSVSFTSASFDRSALPATADNPDYVEVPAIKIDFAPLHFLKERQLRLNIELIEPDIYIEQDESKLWTPTDFGSEESSSDGFKVEVESIQLDGGQLTLAAYNSETAALNPKVTSQLERVIVRPTGDRIEFDAVAQLLQGGSFNIDGSSNTKTGIIDLDILAQQLDASAVSNLLALPIELNRGSFDGRLGVVLNKTPLPQLQGALDLKGVSMQIPDLVKPFSNSNGKIRFDGSQIELNNVSTNFGQVGGLASGTLDLAGEGNYQINTKLQPVAASKAFDALEIETPVPVKGKIKGEIAVRGNLENPVVKLDLATASPSQIDRLDFKQVKANLELVGTTLNVRQFTSLPKAGGKIEGNGKLQLDGLQNMAFNVRAENLAAKAIARSYQNQLPVDIERVSGQANISARAGDLSTLKFRNGSANFALGNGIVEVDNLDYGSGTWTSRVRASGVEFGSLPFGEGSAPTIAQGLVDGVFQVAGTADLSNLNRLKATGNARLDTVGGEIALPQIAIANGSWRTDAKTENLQLQNLFPELPDEFNDDLSGKFYLTGNIPDVAQPQTIINGFGDLALADGRVEVSELKIVDRNWTAIAEGTDLKLQELSSSTPEQFAGLVNGTLKLAGTTDNITPEGIKADGEGSLTLPEGVFAARNLAISDGRFQADVTPQQVDLSLFADPESDDLELNGQLGGQLAVRGKVDNLSPTAVSAEGNLSFSQGIDLLEQPLSADITWNGKRLDVLAAKGDGLNTTGYIVLDETFFGDIADKLAAVKYFEFNVSEARWLDIRKLRLTLPSWATNLDYAGRGDFAGRIGGTPSAMTINGNVGLKDFRVEELEFAPFLAGNVQISPSTGVKLSLQEILTAPLLPATADFGIDSQPLDKIELVLDSNFAPIALAIAKDYLLIEGTGRQEILDLTARSVPVELLKTIAVKGDDFDLPENFALQPVNGELSGEFSFNLDTLATTGTDVVIENPALASIRGDRLEGDFQYADGYFAIQDVAFQQRNSIYKLDGSLRQQPGDLLLDGKVTIEGGQIQDILVGLQVFELSDFTRIFRDRQYGNADSLYQTPPTSSQQPIFDVGLANAPIIDRLQLLSAIQAELAAIRRERQTALVPSIENLRGTFDGQIEVFGSVNEGLTSEFDFSGQQWRWGKLVGEQIVARGNLEDGILTLLPISVQLQNITEPQAADTENVAETPTLLFTGTFGGNTQSGQFRLVDIPVRAIEQLFSLPPELAIDGLINATASIAGTQADPQARGEIRIDNASLNDTSIQSTKGSFNYKTSRLDFSASSVIVQDAEPLIVRGSIPYQLPFAKIEPESNRLELQLDVQNKGLALLDILSRGELKWIGGKGQIALDISGVLDAEQNLPQELSAKGTAIIEEGTIAAKSLPKNLLTNINSEVFFDFDNIRVNRFRGDFGGGKITAAGTVPLGEGASPNPLRINFDEIEQVELPELYDGGVRGSLQILGQATEPNITGDLTLFDGTIFLVDEDESPNAVAEDTGNTDNSLAAVTQYSNLQLQLGKNVQISQPPIFTFVATGNLNIDGSFLQPNPQGTIVLTRGQVNLFTTQLNLSRDYKNTARFSNNNVLDPFLDVLLVGSAIETTDRTTPSEVTPTEIPDSSLGTLETIRVSAKVKGLASQITNRIELTSSPPRSPAEIAVLLGGGFVENLAGSNGTSGLATLAGSALFGSLNAEFNNIFPIGELRLFPTPIIDENRDDNRDGLAGEIAFDLVDNLSFSVLKILNTDIPAQYGFRYRLDNNFVLRGLTNFQEDGSRALIEYELRF